MRCWSAIYAAFAEGWSDPAGTDSRRRNLAEEAIWLGRLVVSLLPDEPEALGLLALMLHAEARRGARRNADGDYVPLTEQDPALWDAALIDEAEALLLRPAAMRRSAATSSRRRCSRRMPRAASPARTDWAAIVALYDALFAITGSPVVGDQPRRRGRRGARRRSGLGGAGRCWRAMRGSPTTSPIGRRAPGLLAQARRRGCGRAAYRARDRPRSAIRRCGASCWCAAQPPVVIQARSTVVADSCPTPSDPDLDRYRAPLSLREHSDEATVRAQTRRGLPRRCAPRNDKRTRSAR